MQIPWGFSLRVGWVLECNTEKKVEAAFAILFVRIQSGEKTAGEHLTLSGTQLVRSAESKFCSAIPVFKESQIYRLAFE